MKAIIVGDLHIDNRKSSVKNSESFDEIFRLFRQITRKVIDEKPDFVVFLGDIFDSPDNISTNVLSIITMLFNDLSNLTKIIILAGNHDVVDDMTQSVDLTEGIKGHLRSSLVYYFRMNQNIFVIDSAQVTNFDDIKTTIYFIPYHKNIVEVLDHFSHSISDSYTNIMIGHFETRDVNYIKMLPDQSMVEHLPNAHELFTKYKQDLVLLGHVHDRSEIEEKNKRLVYVGSARNINYNNRGESKGIYTLDLNTLVLDFEPNTDTAIYKIFRDSEELDSYLESSDPETLAKTKIKFIYTDAKETAKYSKVKKSLRRLEFEKAVFTDTESNTLGNINLDELKVDTLTSKEKLFDFILDFKEIDQAEREEYLQYLEGFEEESSDED